MDRLMEKLALSKAIMDKADGIKNSNSMSGGLPPTSLQQLFGQECMSRAFDFASWIRAATCPCSPSGNLALSSS